MPNETPRATFLFCKGCGRPKPMPLKPQHTQCFFCGRSSFASAPPKFPPVPPGSFTQFDRTFLFELQIGHE